MKTLFRGTAACLLAALASCSKKEPKPAHPLAGLSISSGGSLHSTCGFYMESAGGISLRPKEMSTGADGHQFNVVWSVDPGEKSDVYHLKLTMDGAISERKVEFSGKPVVLFEQPFRVVLENTPR
jgi:hypothetical protein